jgi:hypothetical protein
VSGADVHIAIIVRRGGVFPTRDSGMDALDAMRIIVPIAGATTAPLRFDGYDDDTTPSTATLLVEVALSAMIAMIASNRRQSVQSAPQIR